MTYRLVAPRMVRRWPGWRTRSTRAVSLPPTRFNIIFDSVEEQLHKDSRNQAAGKSDKQPEPISLKASQQNHNDAQQAHQRSKKSFDGHSPVAGRPANLGGCVIDRGRTSHGRSSFPLYEN